MKYHFLSLIFIPAASSHGMADMNHIAQWTKKDTEKMMSNDDSRMTLLNDGNHVII